MPRALYYRASYLHAKILDTDFTNAQIVLRECLNFLPSTALSPFEDCYRADVQNLLACMNQKLHLDLAPYDRAARVWSGAYLHKAITLLIFESWQEGRESYVLLQDAPLQCLFKVDFEETRRYCITGEWFESCLQQISGLLGKLVENFELTERKTWVENHFPTLQEYIKFNEEQ